MEVCTETLDRACVLDLIHEVPCTHHGVHMIESGGGDTCLTKYDWRFYAHLYSGSCYSVWFLWRCMNLNEGLTYNASISSVLLECKIDTHLGG